MSYTATNVVVGGYLANAADPDGDGQNNLSELYAGTDLNNSASALAVTAVSLNASNHVLLDFQFVLGKDYRIQYSSNLVSWIQIPGAPTLGNPAAGIARWTDDGSLTGGLPVSNRFYRVQLLVP